MHENSWAHFAVGKTGERRRRLTGLSGTVVSTAISRQSQQRNNAQFPALLCLSLPLMNVQRFPVSVKDAGACIWDLSRLKNSFQG